MSDNHKTCKECSHDFSSHLSTHGCMVMMCDCVKYVNRDEVAVDAINPAHYRDGKIEVWDYIVDHGYGYCLGAAVKYIARAGKKDPSKKVEDLEKAINYIDREIRRVKEDGGFYQNIPAKKTLTVDHFSKDKKLSSNCKDALFRIAWASSASQSEFLMNPERHLDSAKSYLRMEVNQVMVSSRKTQGL